MSLVGGQRPPFRAPCPGSVLCGNGKRYRHGKESEENIPVYRNNTTPWYGDTVTGPSPLPTPNPCGIEGYNCTGNYNYKTGTGRGGAGNSGGCGPWAIDNDVPANTWMRPDMLLSVSILDGGTGYAVGNLLNVPGGVYAGGGGGPASIKVVSVEAVTGKIKKARAADRGSYSTNPPSPCTPTNGNASASFTLTFTPETISLSVCCKRGFKNVQAYREHHGTRPWTTGNGNADKALVSTAAGGAILPFASFQPTVDDVKYLTVTYDVHLDWQHVQENGDGIYSTSTGSGSVSVDPLTGGLTSSLWTSQDKYGYSGEYHTSGGSGPDGGAANADTMFWDLHLSNFPGWPAANGAPWYGAVAAGMTLPDIITAWNAGLDSSGTLLPPLTDFNNYSGSASIPFADFLGLEGNSTSITISFSRSATVVSWDIIVLENYTIANLIVDHNGRAPGDPLYYVTTDPDHPLKISGGDHTHSYGSMTLSVPNPGSAVLNDIDANLLSLWPLNDDALYPFRTDGYCGFAPLVTRNESGETSPIKGFLGPSWVDPNAALYDGSIRGAPNPAGYQKSFDFRRENWIECAAIDSYPAYMDVNSYGAWTPDVLPQNCTQWTNDNTPLPSGAGVYYKKNIWAVMGIVNPPTGIFKQKWVETLLPWQSHNFARPAGADKFSYDETVPHAFGVCIVYQVVSVSGSGAGAVVTLSDGGGNPITPPDFGAYAGQIWGGISVGGFYLIASATGSTVTLGAKQFNVPTGWPAVWSSGDSATTFGRLRFPDAPGIIGRVVVTTVADESPVKLTITGSPYLALNQVADEKVDILDKRMNVLASNVTVTRVSDPQFTVPTAYATIAAAKWIVAHGAASWHWNDTTPKHSYLLLDFLFNYRARAEAIRINDTITSYQANGGAMGIDDLSPLGSPQSVPLTDITSFNQTQGCLPFTPCDPSVVCISPNGESFPNGVTYGFPAVALDEQDGTQWQSCVVQAVIEPLWQVPHVPSSPDPDLYPSVFAWAQDNGGCNDDTIVPPVVHHPHPPLVEAFCYLPGEIGADSTEITADSTETTADGAGPNGDENARALPDGIAVGFLSPVDHTTGDIAWPPALPGGDQPWWFYNQACGCISGYGRFMVPYGDFMICEGTT